MGSRPGGAGSVTPPGKPRARKAGRSAAAKKKSGRTSAAKKVSGRKSSRKKAAASKSPPPKLDSSRRVFFFGEGRADGGGELHELLGGKGANLAEMTSLGLPVPPGFTISTAVCAEYQKRRGKLAADIRADVLTALAGVERIRGRGFGDPQNPLLVSVRSGARVSMPGMMDTILNLGLNAAGVQGLVNQVDERFAYDTYRRFIQMYADVVLHVPLDRFEHKLENAKFRKGVELDTELEGSDWRALVREYLELVEQQTGRPFPQDPEEQLWGAISAVFESWDNDRAKAYRRLHGIDDSWGTAV
ncbi:MAG: PEP/pyruvate-binding domain-containing protein, partial [Myxococcota bacterium]